MMPLELSRRAQELAERGEPFVTATANDAKPGVFGNMKMLKGAA